MSRLISEIRKSIAVHGVPKAALGEDRRVVITSIGTERSGVQAERRFLEWRADNGLDLDGPYIRAEVMEFLHEFGETHGQSALDATRMALGRVLSLKLPPMLSLVETVRRGRATRPEELKLIVAHQHDRNALASLIAWDAGLRAIELLTLRRHGEHAVSAHRNWPQTMFLGRQDTEKMVVTGKGGLRRTVSIARCLVAELEKWRRPAPVTIEDRGVRYQSFYCVGGGQAFSQSFSRASLTALGASTGAHGLRHGYAQRRVSELRALGWEFMDAIQLVSVELGHFRPILGYYQPR
jgi:integrase